VMTKRPPRVDATQIESKKIEFQLEFRSQFGTLQELYDIDTMRETFTDIFHESTSRVVFHESTSRVVKATNKQVKPRISSPTPAVMTTRRAMVANGDYKQRIDYAETCIPSKIKAG